MHRQLFLSPLLHHSIATIIFILITFPTCNGDDDDQYTICNTTLYHCGATIQNVSYPFWGANRPPFCGVPGFQLTCNNNNYTTIDINNQNFRLLSINSSTHLVTIAPTDLWDDICLDNFNYSILDDTLFSYGPDVRNLNVFYDCRGRSLNISVRNRFTCMMRGSERVGFYADESFSSVQLPEFQPCERTMTVPVLRRAIQRFTPNETIELLELLNEGFDVEYRIEDFCSACQTSGGLCWSGTNSTQPSCLCKNIEAHPLMCPEQGVPTRLYEAG
ncbi:unnamed protein product [Ilex paraguariensis]|uniref:non-specific serine/threonine protein kinase n=1 Tax=Ilex paraguariensis TaxID=185542 RepID=A0ABC8SL86_9AQUA